MKRPAVLLILLLFSTAAFAELSVVDQYKRGLEEAREGSPQKAVGMLLKIQKDNPEHYRAADALYQAGVIADKKLMDWDRAQKIYGQVIEKYPSSKHAPRAKKRLDYLVEARKSGDKPLKVYNKVLAELPVMGIEKAIKEMTRLYNDYPKFMRRPEVGHWIGESHRRMKRYDEALKYYEEVLQNYPSDQFGYFSLEKIGTTYLEMGDSEKATQMYKKLAGLEDKFPGASQRSKFLINKMLKDAEKKAAEASPAAATPIPVPAKTPEPVADEDDDPTPAIESKEKGGCCGG